MCSSLYSSSFKGASVLNTENKQANSQQLDDLEIKDAGLIFARVWANLETEFGKRIQRLTRSLVKGERFPVQAPLALGNLSFY